MKENKCLVCGYVEDGTNLGKFVDIPDLCDSNVEKGLACPVCGSVRVVFNHGYYNLEPNKEEQELEAMRRCKDHGVEYMEIFGKDKNKPNKAGKGWEETTPNTPGHLDNDFNF